MNVMMKFCSAVVVSVALAGLSVSTIAHAAPVRLPVHVQAMLGKTKMVKITLRNDSSTPLELKVGENVMTLDTGKKMELKLAVGTRIVTNVATSTHEAGALLAEVSPQLDDATIGIK